MSGTTRTNGPNLITAMNPVLVDYDGSFNINVILGSAPEADELLAGASFLNQELDSRPKVTPQVKPGGFTYQLSFSNYITDADIANVGKLVQPKYTAQATASAKVKRHATTEVHTSTVVRLMIDTGVAGNVDAKEISAMSGVLRAQWLGTNKAELSFTVAVPTEENVQSVTKAVAEKLGVYVKRPVPITDPNPDAALDPEKDHKAIRETENADEASAKAEPAN